MSFKHVGCRIADPERSRRFYEALGMEHRRELTTDFDGRVETHVFYAFPGEDESLQLTFDHDGRAHEAGSGHFAVGVADLDATLAELEAQGIEPERGPFQIPGHDVVICFVPDPDGHSVELFGQA